MSARVDALFSGDPAAVALPAGPLLRRLRGLLALSIPMNAFGALCWTGVPGAALTLWAWSLADGEMARIESGEYSTADAASLLRLRRWCAWNLGLCVASLVVQAWLLTTSFYTDVLSTIYGWWMGG